MIDVEFGEASLTYNGFTFTNKFKVKVTLELALIKVG